MSAIRCIIHTPLDMPAVTFGPYRLELTSGDLHRSGIAVRLQPQPSRLLVLLVQHAGQLVTRDDIRRLVWGTDTFVDFDQSVNFCVRQIRTALHDHADRPCYIETVPRRGYRFIAPVLPVVEAREAAVSPRKTEARRPPGFWPRLASTLLVVVLVSAVAYVAGFRKVRLPQASSVHSRADQDIELGRFFLNKFSAPGAQAAIERFETAARRDPTDARAYAGLAEAYNQLSSVFIAGKPPANARLLALRAAMRAIQLDPGLAEGYAALGYTALHEFAWTEAEAALRRAIELNPRYMPAHLSYAGYLAARRRFAEAIAEARRGLDIEPASVRARQVLAWMLYFDRQYDAAIQELQTILQMDHTYALAHFRLGQVLLVTRRWDEAVPPLQTAVDLTHRGPAALGLLAMAYGGDGRRQDAQRLLDELEDRSSGENVPSGALLLAYLAVDDEVRAVDMVARGYDERDNYEVNIASDPLMDPLRDSPRFQALCRQVMVGTRLDAADILLPNLARTFRP